MPSSTPAKTVILITGANQGIGYEAVKLLSVQQPDSIVLLGTRSLDNGQKAILRMKEEQQQQQQGDNASTGSRSVLFDNVRAVELDVTKRSSIDAAAERVRNEYGRLDVLMCNAGVSGGNGESPETVFDVNINGVHNTMEGFLPLIPANGLIVAVASEVGAWAANDWPPELQQKLTSPGSLSSLTWPLVQQLEADWLAAFKGAPHEQPWPIDALPKSPYPTSKALVIAYLRSFALHSPQPKLVIVCPGYCSTKLNHHTGPRPAAKGGESVCWPVLHPTEAETGHFYQDGHEHPFLAPMPQWAVEGYKKMAANLEAKAREQAK